MFDLFGRVVCACVIVIRMMRIGNDYKIIVTLEHYFMFIFKYLRGYILINLFPTEMCVKFITCGRDGLKDIPTDVKLIDIPTSIKWTDHSAG